MSFTAVSRLPRREPTGFSTHCRCCHTTLRAFPLFSSILPTLADRLGEDWASRTSRLERGSETLPRQVTTAHGITRL